MVAAHSNIEDLVAEPDIRLMVVAPEHVESVWPVVYPLLSKADIYTNGRFAAHTFKPHLLDGRALLFTAVNVNSQPMETYAAFVAEKDHYEEMDKLVFTIVLAGGEDIRTWAHIYPAIKELARQQGCNQLEIIGRRGWKRFLAPTCREASTVFIDEAF